MIFLTWLGPQAGHTEHPGLTQEQVAARIGISVIRVFQIERGDVSTQDVRGRYVSALGGTLKLAPASATSSSRSPDQTA